MSQGDVLKILEKAKKPLTSKQIYKRMRNKVKTINSSLLKLYKARYLNRIQIKREGAGHSEYIYSIR